MLPFKPNKKYNLIAIYAGAVCAITITIALILLRFTELREAVKPFFNALEPILYGAIFAYLLRPLVRRLEILFRHIFKKRETLTKICAITLSYLIVAVLLFLFFFYLFPALLGDTSDLGAKLSNLLVQGEELFFYLFETFNLPENTFDQIVTTVSKFYQPVIDGAIALLTKAANAVYRVVLGFFLAIAFLFHREKLAAACKRCAIALLPTNVCRFLSRVVSYSDHTFGKYLVGRIVEAVIIATVYLIILPLIGMPYPYLVTVIMVITNFIPIVGAVIGGIPCGILILTENPIMLIWFIVICVGLEQIDGNIIIPRLIGSILGLRAVCIMLAVAVFGALFGMLGMFLSAPAFSIIYMIVRDAVNKRLEKKGQSTDIEEYTDLFSSHAAPRRRFWHNPHPRYFKRKLKEEERMLMKSKKAASKDEHCEKKKHHDKDKHHDEKKHHEKKHHDKDKHSYKNEKEGGKHE